MYYIVFIWEWFENEEADGTRVKRFKAFKTLTEAGEYSLSVPEDTSIECFDNFHKFITFLKNVGYFIEEIYE